MRKTPHSLYNPTCSADHLKMLKVGEPLGSITACIYPGAGSDKIQKYASMWRVLGRESLADGWKAVIAPLDQQGCIVAVANLSLTDGESDLPLSWNDWAPVFSSSGVVSGSTLKLSVRLNSLETFRDDSSLFVRTEQGKKLTTRRIGPGRYELIPVTESTLDATIKWGGPRFQQGTIENQAGIEEIQWHPISSEDGKEIHIEGRTILTFIANELLDNTGPFVEVVKPKLDSNGKLIVSVRTEDRSGIASVALYMDNALIGDKTAPPYEWEMNPKHDMHTFTATAIDASPSMNKRLSHQLVWFRKASVPDLNTNK